MMQPGKDSLDVGMIVSDIERSREFYEKLLGLSFQGTMKLPFGTMYRFLFGTSQVKLIQPGQQPPPAGAIGLEKQLGFRYITFYVKNLSELCSELKEKGVQFTVSARELAPGRWIAMVKDPDGNIVEFVQAP
jgi:catechol 2,3-dioxygenase-like lactoylglutathione lyase family enzyme